MSKKKTPQDAKYSSAKRIEIIENVLIFLSCIYSPFWDKLKYISDYNFIINILFIFLINLVAFLRQSYFFKASDFSRKFFLDDSFNRQRTGFKTDNYYDNNEVEYGFKRVLANLHENSLYTYEISNIMFRGYMACFVIVVSIFILTFPKQNVTLVLLNYVNSSNLFFKVLSIGQLSKESKKIFEEANEICSRYKENGCSAVAIESDILEKWLQYEVLLDDAKILLWNWVFKSKNEDLEKRWENHKKTFDIYKE